MTTHLRALRAAALIVAALVPACAFAQATPPLSTCSCAAVPGDRAEGWRGQGRAEVMAPHGSGMPPHGILTVTGSAWGWEDALKRFGTAAVLGGIAFAALPALVEDGFMYMGDGWGITRAHVDLVDNAPRITHYPLITHTQDTSPTHRPTHYPLITHTQDTSPTHRPTHYPLITHTQDTSPTHRPTHYPLITHNP